VQQSTELDAGQAFGLVHSLADSVLRHSHRACAG